MAPYPGGCLCGALRYRVTGRTCGDCSTRLWGERMSGSIEELMRLWRERSR
jgi:hypothetical protein